ncbi:MAG: helix-turn-helix transcriptional regulator [Nocardioidaceae bacterium]
MKTETNPLSVLDPLVTITELAEYLDVTIKTIYEWRQSSRGPVGIRIGRHLKFRLTDVQAWVDGVGTPCNHSGALRRTMTVRAVGAIGAGWVRFGTHDPAIGQTRERSDLNPAGTRLARSLSHVGGRFLPSTFQA